MTANTDRDLREQVEKSLRDTDWKGAEAALRLLWAARPGAATAQYVLNSFHRMRDEIPLLPCHVKILRSFTLEPVLPLLEAAARTHRLHVSARAGGLNAYAQEILDSDDDLYSTPWNAVVLAVHTRDIAPALWSEGGSDTQLANYRMLAGEVVAQFRELIQAFRERSASPLVVHTLESPTHAMEGVLDHQRRDGQLQAIREINHQLQRIAADHRGVYVLDYDGLAARYGRERWSDERMWLSAKLPLSAPAMLVLVNEWLKFLCPLAGRTCKAVVADLDNTLWGGVVGEDGMDGIQLENRYPGAAYLDVQRALLDLRRRGILLAVASKNNLEDAMAVLERHPGMLVRPEHLAAYRIDWFDKAANIRAIADELNIGIDSLAFLDDNPIERARVRSELPEVLVIEVGEDPFSYGRIIRDTPELQRLELSEEDSQRSQQYAEQRLRTEAEREAPTLASFYRSLKQRVEISKITPATSLRVAQLTQKTNQFNATTRRYTETQMAALASRPGWEVFTVRAEDKFGDHGLIGTVITDTSGGTCEIDTFLLSCRVISRTIETAILSFLVERCRAQAIGTIQGWIVPTPKNKPARALYEKHGFRQVDTDGERSLWALDLSTATVHCPEWIDLNVSSDRTLVERAS